MKDLAIVCPTRSRPDICRSMIESALATSDADILLYVDADDPLRLGEDGLDSERVKLVIGPPQGRGKAVNHLCDHFREYRMYLVVSDDILFVRSDWDDSAAWFGYFDGVTQLFRDGHRTLLHAAGANAPITFPIAVIYLGPSGMKFRVTLGEEQEAVILAGLSPRHTYRVEIDDEEVFEAATDTAGILVLDLLRGKEVGVRLRE